MITISSERLRVSFLEPGEGTNNKTRFDRAGYLNQVELDGSHTFCGTEPDGKRPSTGGAGLCSEIQCDELSYGITEGNQFPKFGVGILTQRNGTEYSIFQDYDYEPFATTWETEENRVIFRTEAREWNGIALYEEICFTAVNNTVIKEYYFRNKGNKTLLLSEYCHNFLSFDGREVDSSFRIMTPMLSPQTGLMPRSPEGRMRGTEYGFGFMDSGTAPSTLRPMADQIDRSAPFKWTVICDANGLSVSGIPSFYPAQLAMWSVGNLVSPEIFHRFALAPEDEIHYWRRWTFHQRKA